MNQRLIRRVFTNAPIMSDFSGFQYACNIFHSSSSRILLPAFQIQNRPPVLWKAFHTATPQKAILLPCLLQRLALHIISTVVLISLDGELLESRTLWKASVSYLYMENNKINHTCMGIN